MEKRLRDLPSGLTVYDGETVGEEGVVAQDTVESVGAHTDYSTHIFAVSAGLTGVSLSAIGLFSIVSHMRATATFGEQLLAVDAGVFVASCVSAFLAMKRNDDKLKRGFQLAAEWLCLAGLVVMAAICAFLAFSIRGTSLRP